MSNNKALTALVATAGTALALHNSIVDVPADLTARELVADAYGYSIEPVWLSSFVNSSLMTTLLQEIADVTGKAPPIRIGGTTSDETTLYASIAEGRVSNGTGQFNITSAWYATYADYFPNGTNIVYTLNFAANQSNWANAQAEAEAAWTALGDKLIMFELGNEVDHFIAEDWRAQGWGVAEYIPQFNNLTATLQGANWYQQAGSSAPKFQAAVFADPPWVPDQQDEVDDFDIVNLTAEGLVDREHKVVESYSVHLYPQSTCDAERWLRMRLDLLSNHTVLWLNVSQYIPQVAAADNASTPLVMGETNSISCSGRSGISDTFGAALWSADYVLMAASIGIPKVYFHLGAQSQYSAFTPEPYELDNETLSSGIRANFYSHYFVAKVVEGLDATASSAAYNIAALPGANTSDLSGYVVYQGGSVAKVVLLDMGVWNGTEGLSNPSTLSSTDGTVFSNGTRPVYRMRVATPWSEGSTVDIVRLQGPGTNAKSLVNVSGVTFDSMTGVRMGNETVEQVAVEEGGTVRFSLSQAEAVLLTVQAGNGSGPANSSSATAASSGAAKHVMSLSSLWSGAVTMGIASLVFLFECCA